MAREKPMIVSLEGYCTEAFARLEGYPDHREDVLFHVEMRKCRSMGRVAIPQAKAA